MANFTKSDLKYNYHWSLSPKDIVAQNFLFYDAQELNVNQGFEVLRYINSYIKLKNYSILCTFKKIEKAIKEELPEKKRGHYKIKRWPSENFFF